MNDSAVLDHIMCVGEVTRAELAAHTGFSRGPSSRALARLDFLGLALSKGRSQVPVVLLRTSMHWRHV